MIICLEGIDACGKGEQAKRLQKRLTARLFKFPDRDTPTGKLIYEHLEERWWTDGKGEPELEAHREALVFQTLQLANRMEVATNIMQAASKGDVVFDRYWPSGYAYGRADGLSGEYLTVLHHWLPQPDLFVLLDIDPSTSAERRPERRDRYERAGDAYLHKVVSNYRELWDLKRNDSRWVQVDARGSQESTESQISLAVQALR